MTAGVGVSFVVPVHNGAPQLRDTLAAILEQDDGRPMEIIVVEDGSRDASLVLLQRLAAIWPLRIVPGEGRGAAAAINLGVRSAQYPIVCQIDQDVVLLPGWLTRVIAGFDDPGVAAVQGCYVTDPDASFFARAMGLDLEQRYSRLGRDTDHVCTGNVAYCADALRAVGLFDESLGYGYDNDMSYRLQRAGYRLAFCRTARSHHRWREGLRGYLQQQYGFGYGRLDVVARHPGRIAGDAVSRASMVVHPAATLAALLCFLTAIAARIAGLSSTMVAWAGALLLGALATERLMAGFSAARRFRDPTALLFPLVHLLRDLAWVAAMAVWTTRRLARTPPRPMHSMHPREASTRSDSGRGPASSHSATDSASSGRLLAIVPAHNEAESLGSVVAELRRCRPEIDILVVDDGSTDATDGVLRELSVRSIRFPERLGIGNAMRAGVRYALRSGHTAAVRIDGDGQHRVDDIAQLLAPIEACSADVTIGSRYRTASGEVVDPPVMQRLLAECLSLIVQRRVTDPTSGFCALNARAMTLLAEHHPTGYPEPELLLFLHRNHMRVAEVPVTIRERIAGRTSLTPSRLTTAGARVLLAMLIVPLRGRVGGL